jgi:hypothetical protein
VLAELNPTEPNRLEFTADPIWEPKLPVPPDDPGSTAFGKTGIVNPVLYSIYYLV